MDVKNLKMLEYYKYRLLNHYSRQELIGKMEFQFKLSYLKYPSFKYRVGNDKSFKSLLEELDTIFSNQIDKKYHESEFSINNRNEIYFKEMYKKIFYLYVYVSDLFKDYDSYSNYKNNKKKR